MVNRRAALLMMALAVALMGGCQSAAKLPPHRGLSLKLYCRGDANRQTYLELDKGGKLAFGGGRDAAQRVANPVMTLSDAQSQAVYDVIQRHDLLHAKGALFDKAQHTTYELDLRVDGKQRSLRAVDDQVPGLRELNDLLFDMQARERYRIQ
jgi:hypothetical protein